MADLLSAGETAGALERALELRNEILAAIDAGEVPAALGKRLLAGIDRLIESIPPPEEPVEEPPEEEPEEQKDEEKDEEEAPEEEAPEEDTTETDTTEEIPDDIVPGNDKGNGNAKGLDG